MDPKLRPNNGLYIQALRRMGAAGRLAKVFELSEFTRRLFEQGLRKRNPGMPEAEFRRLLLWHHERCHNSNK
jgi:hypothetical protein